MELGEKLKTLRLQDRLTLVELAEKSGVSKSLLSRIEQGRSVPTITTIQKIASAFGIILSDFFADRSTSYLQQDEADALVCQYGTPSPCRATHLFWDDP